MIDRYEPQLPRVKIARILEFNAGREFGPERLKKADLARCFNLGENDINDAEWADIYEFAVNAGVELRRNIIAKDLPSNPGEVDKQVFRKRIRRDADGILPIHDIFHAAETYRLSHGQRATAAFAEAKGEDRYMSPETIVAELYPSLFYVPSSAEHSFPIMLSIEKERKTLAKSFGEVGGKDNPARAEVIDLLESPIPTTPSERKADYEKFMDLALVHQVRRDFPEIAENKIAQMRENFDKAIKNPPEHYTNFASRVFNEEWKTNPRLFLDEFLDCIRTKPELHPL